MPNLMQFFNEQRDLEQKRNPYGSTLAGYVLETGYESFTVMTNTAMQSAAGPLSRGGFLLAMATPSSAVLLRVQAVVPSPLKGVENLTNYELGKRAMPDLDPLTNTDMSWSCRRCDVLGCFYEMDSRIFFSGDLLGLAAPSAYRVYQPGYLLDLVVNGVYGYDASSGVLRAMEYNGGDVSSNYVPLTGYDMFGCYRATERFPGNGNRLMVYLYLADIAGHRTALFGKTRSGKSNAVKVMLSALLHRNKWEKNLGQVIIDTNGEYANDNPQDGICLKNRFPDQCQVYAIHAQPGSGARVLRCNFYLVPELAMELFRNKLMNGASKYIAAFLSVPVPSLDEIRGMAPGGDRIRAIRRVQLLWVILAGAGFPVDEASLAAEASAIKSGGSPFDPGFSAALRSGMGRSGAPDPTSLSELREEWKALFQYHKLNPDGEELKSTGGNPLLEANDLHMLEFLYPDIGSGVKCLSVCKYLHHKDAGNFLREIPELLDESKTVILDLSNAAPSLVSFFTSQVCDCIFHHQEALFTSNGLGDHYVQLCAEEAHNYFPATDKDSGNIFSRIAKEGAKYHIGRIYSTQSPSTISGELLSQTENFLVAHLDSTHEVEALVRRSAPFSGVAENILRTRTPGYVHLLTASQRYPVPVQIKSFRGMEGI